MRAFILVVFLSIFGAALVIFLGHMIKRFDKVQRLVNFQLLKSACFDDELKALKLIKEEKRRDYRISDEEAAARALDVLLAKDKFQDHMQIDFYI
jgi:hypothetical protein